MFVGRGTVELMHLTYYDCLFIAFGESDHGITMFGSLRFSSRDFRITAIVGLRPVLPTINSSSPINEW